MLSADHEVVTVSRNIVTNIKQAGDENREECQPRDY